MPTAPRIKHFPTDFRMDSMTDEGEFSGFLAVYGNVDSAGDRILPGAFRESLREQARLKRKFPVLWQHNWNEPIGVFESLVEQEEGLYVERGRLITDVPRAAQARVLMAAGAVTGMSIGFEVVEERTSKDGVNELRKLKLWEGSIVTFPANDLARIDAVKSALRDGGLPSLSAFEDFLREAGFSKTEATVIANRGLAHLLRRSESGGDITAKLQNALDSLSRLSIHPTQE